VPPPRLIVERFPRRIKQVSARPRRPRSPLVPVVDFRVVPVEIDDPTPTGSGFTATNNGVQYAISRDALVITKGSNVISNEPMLEYWSA
jgi:hypothetical protein